MVNPTITTIKRNDVHIHTKCSRFLFIYMKENGFRPDQVNRRKQKEKEEERSSSNNDNKPETRHKWMNTGGEPRE